MRVVTLAVALATVCWNIADGRTAEPKAIDCTYVADGTFVYDTCASFVVCYGGEGISQNCALGSYFDATEETCLPDTADICPQNAVECTEEGAFTENVSSCSSFYVCYEGRLVEQNCGSGSYFDAVNSNCAPDAGNTCWPVECTENGAFSENPENCSMFYVCYDGKLVEQSCGTGSYFDSVNLYCLPDVDNVCWAVEATSPAPCPCPGGYAEGEFVANPDSCYLYSVCSEGQLLEQNCGAGNYFDANTKTCEKDVSNVCWPQETTTTEAPASCACPGGYAEGEFVVNPDSCYLYSVCSEGQLLEQNCGAGNYFDANTKTCERDVSNVCWPQETTTTEAPASCSCPGGYAEGEFVANPDSCYLYSVCSEGQLLEQNCGAGNYFDANTKTCEKDVSNVCWPQETTTTEAPASCACPGGYAEGEFVANPDSCYLYSVCSEGQLLEQNCGAGNYFDANTKTCEKDLSNVCWPQETTTTEASASCACPGGYAEGEFVANPDSCYLYSVCSEGQLLEQNCGAGNYFDANTKTCEKDVSNVCWPQETTTTEAPASCSCPGGYAEGEFVAKPDSCYLYSICSEGQLLEQNCGAGNYFDANTKTCEKDVSNVCWPQETATTEAPASCSCPGGLVDGDLIENEDSCSAYFICFNGELTAESCGNGNYFDRTHKACVRDNEGSCWISSTTTSSKTMLSSSEIQSTSSDIMPTLPSVLASSFENRYSCPAGYVDGDLLPYPGNCSMFYACLDRTLIEVSCGYGNYFDNGLKSCVVDAFGVCWRTSPSTPITTPSSAAQATVKEATSAGPVSAVDAIIPCPDGYKDGDFATYSSNCSMFYICVDAKLIEQSCGFGSYFDAATENCILDTLGICWQSAVDTPTSTAQTTTSTFGEPNSCPDGYEDGDLAPYPNNCFMFYFCYNGKLMAESCGYGNYFDSSSKSCILDTLGQCWQTLRSVTDQSQPAWTTTTMLTSIIPISTRYPTTTASTPQSTTQQISSTGSPLSAVYACPEGYADGDFAAYSSNCSMFYICDSGQLMEKACGYGNYFDSVSKNCILDTFGICWQPSSPSVPSTTAETTPVTQTSISTDAVALPCPKGFHNGEFIAYPKNCFMFYFCFNGELIEETCGYGNYFDNSSKSCVLDTLGVCWPVQRPMARSAILLTKESSGKKSVSTSTRAGRRPCDGGEQDGDFVPYPNNCSMFYVCYKGKSFKESCGYGNYFDNFSKSCILDVLGVCWKPSASPVTNPSTTTKRLSSTAPSTIATAVTTRAPPATKQSILGATNSTPSTYTTYSCAGGFEYGEFVPYPNNCSMFFICYNGKLTEESCGYGNYFDKSSKSCVLDTLGVCWQAPMPPATAGTQHQQPSTTPSTTTRRRASSTTAAAPSSLRRESIRWSTTRASTTIATSTLFDENPYSCLNGHNEGELFAYPNNCSMFYICYKGMLIVESCGYNNYFDRPAKRCVFDPTHVCSQTKISSAKKDIPSTVTSSTAAQSTVTTSTAATTTAATSIATTSTATPSTVPCLTEAPSTETTSTAATTTAATATATPSTATPSTGTTSTAATTTAATSIATPSTAATSTETTSKAATSTATSPITAQFVVKQPTNDLSESVSGGCSDGNADGEFIPHPSNCYQFLVCYRGVAIEMSCGLDNYYDETTKSCVPDKMGICWPKSTSPTTSSVATFTTDSTRGCIGGHLDGELVPVPEMCYLFFVCYKGELITLSCGEGNYFDRSSKSCAPDTRRECWKETVTDTPTAAATAPELCSNGMRDGQIASHQESCHAYHICDHGQLVERSCGLFNYFNPSTSECEKDSEGKCWPTQPTAQAETKKVECPNGLTDGQFTASPSSCLLYQICTNGELVEGNCGTFNYFNPLSNNCERDLSGVCWPIQPTAQAETKTVECPNGLKDGQFTASPSSCFLYQICTNGELVEGNCGTFNYFNPLSNNCERDISGVCWPIQPTAQAETKTVECPNGLKDGQFTASPSSCFLYQICTNGELVEGNCGTFNYFNPLSNNCERDISGVCWPIQPTAQAETKTVECPNGLKDGQFTASPSSCFLYQICTNGELVEGNCGTFNYFNPLSNNCERDLSGVCWPIQPTAQAETKTVECPNGLKDGQFTASPSSCFLYQICTNGELVEGNCGTFNYFNPLSNNCERDLSGVCFPIQPTAQAETKTVECPNGLKDGQFTASPSSCFLYQICTNGELVEGNCGTFNYFNPLSNNCERDLSGVCWPIQPTAQAETKTVECPNGLKDGQFTASPSSCFLYQICTNGELVEGNCGTFNYFNPLSNNCERDLSGVCWPIQPTAQAETKTVECPNGLKDGQFTASPSSCFLYQICTNGELVEGNCGTFNYFNPLSNNCERDLSGVCWPIQPTAQAETKTVECPNGLKDGQFTASPSSCFLYQICTNGELVEGNCGTSNYFNTNTNLCEPDTNGICRPTPTTTSAKPIPTESTPTICSNGQLNGQLSAHGSSCSAYMICTAGELVEGNCGVGNYFNSNNNICEPDTNGICWPCAPETSTEAAVCPYGLLEGQFTSHSTSCSRYYICSGGELVEGNCGLGNYFNKNENICERDTTGQCWPLKPTPPTPPTPPRPTPPANPTAKACPSGTVNGQFLPDPSSCHLYYICNNGRLLDSDCGSGNIFNRSTLICEPDKLGVCWPSMSKPCPVGVLNGQFIANPSSCQQYQICNNGQLLNGDCGAGKFFNRNTLICEPDVMGICDPANAVPTPVSKPCHIGVLNGQFIANPSSCQQYQICNNGQLLNGDCGAGKFFNRNTLICEPDVMGICDPANAVPTPVSKPCPIGVLNGQFIANPSSCQQYQICNNGQLLNGDCGAGKFFNRNTLICEPDVMGICDPANAVPTPVSKPCPIGVLNGQFIANPSSCQQYQICNNGQLLNGDCGAGKFFNRDTLICEPDVMGICDPANAVPTPVSKPCPIGVLNGQFIANPSSCQQYQICNNGQLLNGDCGAGKFFNRNTLICEPDVMGICDPANAVPTPVSKPCPIGVLNGQFIANPSSCQQYQICSNGQLLNGDCGAGKFFNRNTLICEPDVMGICDPANAVPTPVSKPCPIGVLNGQFIANPSSCQQYQICNNGQLLNGDCGAGKFFNRNTLICEPDLMGICDPANALPANSASCPNGMLSGQFMANPSSCHKYQICYNGQLLSGDCGAGKLFNKNTLICETDVLGICNPINPNACPAGVQNGQFVPIPGECDKFWICYGGSLIEQSCGVGYYYDVDNKYCTRDVSGSCWSAQISSDTCIGLADGVFLPNDAACNKFFMCYNNTKISQECGVGNVFNTATLSCVRDTLGTCWKKVPNVCANYPIGSFVPNPDNCQEFYVCYSNRAVLQQCGNGNYFNSALAVCEPDLNGVCVNVCQGIRGNVSLPHSNCNEFYTCSGGLTTGVGTCPTGTNFDALTHICLSTAVCEANLCSNSANGVVYPVENDVNSFYSCYNQIALKLACPEGTAFDALLSICIPDTGRCVGRKNGFTVASPNNPNAYYVCKSNMAIFEQCPSYAIFDEKKGVCVQAQRRRLVRNICSSEPDGGVLPGDACNTYHLCLDGEVVYQNCGAYSAFSVKLGYCVFNLSCFDRNDICAKASDIEKFPDARRQTSFIKCNNGVAKSEKCQKHLIYSHDIGYCVPREMTMSEDELEELCEDNVDNTMAPALDCRKFYICRKKVAILQQCAVDQYFDVKTGSCQPDVERKCWQRSDTLRRSFFLKSVCGEDQVRVHPDDCGRYEICTFGMWLQKSCPRGQVFDANSKACLPGDADKVCPHARSAVLVECSPEQPLRPSDEACTDYYRCADSQWELKRCPVGEFFNPLAATCSRDVSACARIHVTLPTKDSRCVTNETMPSETNCGLFHICYEGEWWYRQCAEGTYFNKTQDGCTPNDGTCRLTSEKGSCKNGTAKPSTDFNPCSAYHLCVDGNWTVQYCPAGHHFRESRKACMQDDDDEGSCRSGVRNPSAPCVDGDRRHQTSNCASFDLCSFGKWYSVPCPQGFFFDISLRRCIANRGDCSTDGAMRRDCIEGTSRPSQQNCTEFYFCTKGKWYVESCLKGFQYNATIDKCIQTNATCPVRAQTKRPQDKCTDAEAVTSEAHASNCTMYYLCVHGLAVEAECALGQFYDEKAKRCRLNNGSCLQAPAPSDDVCKERANGSQVQNPSNCTSYYTCTDAVAVLSSCPVGEYFNAAAGACQTDTGMCNKVELCDSSNGDSVPHEVFCNIYYSCVRGLAIPVACDAGQLFDPFTKKCTTDADNRCVDGILVGDAICLSGNDSQPMENTEDCSAYIVCSQGTAQRLQCPKGQFFNASTLACAPNNGSCLKASLSAEIMSCTGKNGFLMPDLEHCNGFYVCINGALQQDRCIDGEYFDAGTRRCMPIATNQTCAPVAGLLSALCATSEDDTNFADQSDCRKYFQCNSGELQSKKCRTGESFDTLLGFCRQNDGTCLLENGQRVGACAGKHGKLAVDAENCQRYFTCINGQKIAEECEIGEFFDKATKTCRKDLNNTCKWPENEPVNQTQLSCSGLTELVFYPNVIDGCQTFYQCVKGTPKIHKCPDDLLFNGVSGTCDWKDYVKCIDMTDHHHSDELCVNAKNGTRYGSTVDNCDSYFVCTDGKLSSFRCDNGLKFNTNLDKCDGAANVNCTMVPQI